MGIAFRDFPPTAIYQNGTITVTPPYEGAVVRFDAKEMNQQDNRHYMQNQFRRRITKTIFPYFF